MLIGRQTGGSAQEESQGLSCNILSKDLRPERSKDSVNTARCLVDQHKVCELHNDQALPPVCLPSVPLTSLYVTKFPGLPPLFLQAIKN